MPKSIAHLTPSASITNDPISICAWLTETEPPFMATYIAEGFVQDVRINATGFFPFPTHILFFGAAILLIPIPPLHNIIAGSRRSFTCAPGPLLSKLLRSTHNKEGSFNFVANQNMAGCNPPREPASE